MECFEKCAFNSSGKHHVNCPNFEDPWIAQFMEALRRYEEERKQCSDAYSQTMRERRMYEASKRLAKWAPTK